MSVHAHFVCKLVALAACAAAACLTAAQAADNTRYIGITGNNANPCTLAKPCRTLQRGINVTPAGGELQILDSGSYGNNAAIKKSLTISANGHTVYLGSSIVVDDADAVVALRGLTLDGQGTIIDGIRIDAAATIHIERCVVHGFTQYGIIASADGVELFVLDSISRDNGAGFVVHGSAGPSRLTIDNSRFENNAGIGLDIGSGRAAIHRSMASGNGLQGIRVRSGSVSIMSTMAVQNGDIGFYAFSGTMTVESSVAHGNGSNGLQVGSGGTARISNSTFTANAIGIRNFGIVETRQNNTIRGNGTNVSGALTAIGGV